MTDSQIARYREATSALHEALELHRQNNFSEGTALALRARELYAGYPKEVADCEQLLGILYTELAGQEAAAVQCYRRAGTEFTRLGLPERFAQTERGLGDLFAKLKRWPDAERSYLAAFNAVSEMEDHSHAAIDYLVLAAMMLHQSGAYARAIDAWRSTRGRLLDLGDARVVECDRNIGHGLRAMGDLQGAYTEYVRAREGYVELKKYVEIANMDESLMAVLLEAKRFADAEAAAQRAASIYAQLGKHEQASLARRNVAVIAHRQAQWCEREQRYIDAAGTYLKAVSVYIELEDRTATADMAHRAGRALTMAGEHHQAVQVLTTALNLLRDISEIDAASCAVNLAINLSSLSDWDGATKLLEYAREVFARHDQNDRVLDCNTNLRAVETSRKRAVERLVESDGTANWEKKELRIVLQLRDADRLEEALTQAFATRVRIEKASDGYWLAHSDITLGTIYHDLYDFVKAEQFYVAARDAFVRRGETALVATCERELVDLYNSLGRFRDAGCAATACLQARRTEASPEKLIDALLAYASILTSLGRYGDATVGVEEAHGLAVGSENPVYLAQVQHVQGLIYLETDRVSDAVLKLQSAREKLKEIAETTASGTAPGRRELTPLVLCTGDLARAWIRAGHGEYAVSAIRGLVGIDGFDADHPVAANLHLNLGVAYESLNELSSAEDEFVCAQRLFARRGDLTGIGRCVVNRADLRCRAGRYEEAEELVSGVLVTARSSGDETFEAHVLGTLAWIQQLRGFFGKAEANYCAARIILFSLGRLVEAAQCDIGTAMAMRRRAVAECQEPDFGELLAVLVPAVVFLDGRRFQFRSAADRAAWTLAIKSWTCLAFAWAAEVGDARLVAELVESSINSGVHGVGAVPGAGGGAGAGELSGFGHGLIGAMSAPDGRPITSLVDEVEGSGGDDVLESDGDAISLGGAARLVAGEVLPMTAPPRLRMPDQRIALDPFVEQADARYEILVRPAGVIPTW